MATRILIADDHTMLRQGLRLCLDLHSDLQVVGEAADGAEAVRLAMQLEPDVVLMDVKMPVMDGIAATLRIWHDLPDTKIVAMSSVLEDDKLAGAVRAGASGYVLKNADADELCWAIRAAAAGQIHFSREAAARLTSEAHAPRGPDSLTDREMQVLRLLAAGQSNKEIAAGLHIAEKTVKVHISSILAKLGVQSRTQAALHAVRHGLAALGPPSGAPS